MMKPIKVLMFTERWNVGGIENVIMNIYRNVDFNDIYIDILVAQKETDVYDEEIIKKGGKINSILGKKEKSPILRTIKNIIKFKEAIKIGEYDIIHINIGNAVGLFFAYIAKKSGIKKVMVHSHTTNVGKKNKNIKLLAHKICKKIFENIPTDYIACSDKAAQWLYTKKIINSKRVKIIKNSIDVYKYRYDEEKRNEFRKENDIKEDDFVIGHIGRFNESKNHEFLIDIFESIKKKQQNTKLLLVGEGELEGDIRRKVEDKKLVKDVIFYGNTNDVQKCLSGMDVMVIPSLYEGGPIVAIEAQACGLPGVYSDVINKKIKILDNIKFLSLNDKAEKWAKEILEYRGIERENNIERIIEAEYDIRSLTENINKIYFSIEEQLISIIVPIYNIEGYVEKCIKSIIMQTYTNIEIILVDDGSTDNSGKICDVYKEKDPRIRVVHKENGGLSDARNKGIELAKGKYIIFIDGDDFVDRQFVEILFENLIKFNADVSVCGFKNYYSEEKKSNYENTQNDYIKILKSNEALKMMLDKKCSFGYQTCNKLYKAKLFKDVRFPKGKIYEDLGTIYKLIDSSNKTVYDSRSFYNYVNREGSITKTYCFNNKELNRIELADEMGNFIKGKYKELEGVIELFRCTQYLAVVNVMIRSNKYDNKLIDYTINLIKSNLKDIKKYSNIKQKIQFIVISYSFGFYKILLKSQCLIENILKMKNSNKEK